VLSDDYFSVPVDDILTLHSELTMAGDRISYSSGAVVPATDSPPTAVRRRPQTSPRHV
jgi:hypothetical protein